MRTAGLPEESPTSGGPLAAETASAPEAAVPTWRVSVRRMFVCAALAVGAFVSAFWLARVSLSWVAFCAFFGATLATVIFGGQSLLRMRKTTIKASTGLMLVVGLLTSIAALVFAVAGAFVAILATVGFSRGRQLRRFGKVLLPDVEEGQGWNERSLRAEVPPEVRAGLAAQWRENGRTEHASVAAFARLTLDLMALGAPPQLLDAAQRDAQDEIRHAELCFSLARSLDGRAERPGRFPQAQRARTLSRFRTLALAQLAVDSLIDGALHEGVSARVIAQLVHRCEEAETRGVLKTLAADEGRHTAHGWDVVEWCLAEGGWPVAYALRGALKTIPRTMRAALPDEARDGSWERFGIHGQALEAAEYEKARADIVRRVERMIAPACAVTA